jgi:chemotaxis protein MotA
VRFISGVAIVIISVLAGYLLVGGHLHVLWQPSEFIIILGSAAGSFIIGNSAKTLTHVGSALSEAKEGDIVTKEELLSLLLLLFSIFKIARSKGLLSLESQLDNPFESPSFEPFPEITKRKEVIIFLCDYLRMMTMGCESPWQLESLMDQEIDIIDHENQHMADSIQTLADSTPALGIVAAVLGVIHTMGSIDQPPAVLGKLIGGALVGTFLGVLVSYGFVGPIAQSLRSAKGSELQFYKVVKAAILAFLNGVAPLIAVEFARKNIDHELRPSFSELELATQEL